jgi:hypothetical protein
MWETLLIQLLSKVIIPELLEYTKKKFEETGTWPTKEELEERVRLRADKIIQDGNDFLIGKRTT